jgi:hypothetical protein
MKGFIETLGYNPVLSDHNSFPINPDINAVENCLRVVREQADIFVLIVGGRYGFIPEGDKSVTNLEYLQAKAKGVLVYAFVEQSILSILPVWEANPESDFRSVVDSTKLFEFVSSLRDLAGVWVFPFQTAQEIIATLRQQLAYLFMDALHLRTKLKGTGLPGTLSQLQGEALRLVIERPVAWEYRLFGECLEQEISRYGQLRHDLSYGVSLGKGEYFTYPELIRWFRQKSSEAQNILSATTELLNVALQDALGPPGVPADVEKIVYVARRLADVYRRAIEWRLEHRHIDVDDELQNLVRLHSKLTSNVIDEIEEYSARIQRETKEALMSLPGPGEPPRVLSFTLTLTAPDMEDYIQEMDRVGQLYSIS